MKTFKVVAVVFLFAGLAFSQAFRFDSNYYTSSYLQGIKVLTPLAGVSVSVCNYPANAVPCTNLATLYTDVTAGTICNGFNGCANPVVADTNGNFGFWISSGTHVQYTLSVSGQNFGPYDVTSGITGGANTVSGPWDFAGGITTTTLNKRCFADRQTGADAGAKINACIASLPNGGTVDASGFGAGVQNYSTKITWAGKNIHLICDPTTVFTYAGTGEGMLIGENSDYSEVDGYVPDLNNNVGTTIGIRIQGSWYVKLINVHPLGALGAGIRLSNDGATNRGVYLTTIKDSVIGDNFAGGTFPPPAAKRNAVGLQIESVNASGVTQTVLDNVWNTYATSDCLQIKGTTGQAIGTVQYGGGNSYCGGNGVYVIGAGTDYQGVGGVDNEGSTGWGLYCEANVLECRFTGIFSGNASGDYKKLAQMVQICTNGVCEFYSSYGDINQPNKYAIGLFSAPFSTGITQSSVPLLLRSSNGDSYFRAVKMANDNAYFGFTSTDLLKGMLWDLPNNQVMFIQGGAYGQFWHPGTCAGCTVSFPAVTTTLVGQDTPDTLSNKTMATLKVGASGSTVQAIYKNSATLTYTAIAAQTCQDQPLTITGAVAGDQCSASPAATIGANFSYGGCYISGANTAQVRTCNPTAGSLTPTAVSWTGLAIH